MRRVIFAFSFLFLFFFAAAMTAHAETFDIQGQLAEGGTFIGTFQVETLPYSSPIIALDVTVTGPGAEIYDSGSVGTSFGSSDNYAQVEYTNLDLFYLKVEDSGGVYTLCTYNSQCGGDYSRQVDSDLSSYQDPVTSGSIAAAAPEPSSFALLGTGLATAAGFARRRLLRKA